jgi:predicted P-loop ATPase
MGWREKLAGAFCLMPLQGKIAIQKGFTKRIEPDGIVPADQNYGVILNDGYLVVDVDPRNGGDTSLKELLSNLKIPATLTFTVKTGGGGHHFYFAKPKGLRIKKKLKGFPGIDFLTRGHYVVGPGSIHPDTFCEYEVIESQGDTIADAPEALLNILKAEEVTLLKAPLIALSEEQLQAETLWFKDFVNGHEAPDAGAWNNTVFVMAAEGKDHGLDPETVYSIMQDWNQYTGRANKGAELRTAINSAFSNSTQPPAAKSIVALFPERGPLVNASDEPWGPSEPPIIETGVWEVDRGNKRAKTMVNIINYMMAHQYGLSDMLQLNRMSNDIEFTRCPPWHTRLDREIHGGIPTWKDHDTVRFKHYLASKMNFSVPLAEIEQAVLVVAYQRPYHPIRAYFNRIRPDVNEKYLDNWLIQICGCEDTEYVRMVGRKTLIAAVARVFRPGEPKHEMLILEGPQEIGKSHLCEILGGPWHRDLKLDLKDERKSVEVMRGGLIYEVSELVGFRDIQVEALKRFMSLRSDRVRFAYDRRESNLLRQGIFIGTMNPRQSGYLRDTTGNRRFWPVRCGGRNFDIPKFKQIIDNLWAEAVEAFNAGESLRLTDNVKILAEIEVSQREAIHPWTPIIHVGLETVPDDFVTADMIFERILFGQRTAYNHQIHDTISDIMSRAKGWKGKTGYRKDRRTVEYGYSRVNGSKEEQNDPPKQ